MFKHHKTNEIKHSNVKFISVLEKKQDQVSVKAKIRLVQRFIVSYTFKRETDDHCILVTSMTKRRERWKIFFAESMEEKRREERKQERSFSFEIERETTTMSY